MEFAWIGAEETPEQLSARLGRPLCMLLRANRLYSAEWLMPGRRIFVPEGDFCMKDAGACPAQMLSAAAERFLQEDLPSDNGLPRRLRIWSQTHDGAVLPEWLASGKTITLRPGETIASLAERAGCSAEELRRINRHFARAVPGTQWWAPIQNGVSGV